MRFIIKFFCYINILFFTVLLIQIIALVNFLTFTKQIPQFIKSENIYEKLSVAIQQSQSEENQDFPLPNISASVLQAIIDPVISDSLLYITGQIDKAPVLSLNQALNQAKNADKNLVKQIEDLKSSFLQMLTPEMISTLPEEQQKSANEARQMLTQDKSLSLGTYLDPVRNMVKLLKLFIPVLSILLLISYLLIIILSNNWRIRFSTLAFVFISVCILAFIVSVMDNFVFGIIGNGLDINGIGNKILNFLMPPLFDLSIRYFKAAAIASFCLFLIFFLGRILLFQSNSNPKEVNSSKVKSSK